MCKVMSLIKINNISKIYENGDVSTKALDDVSLQINDGEMVAITGPSGSGKSTLLSILGCIDIPTSGDYYLDTELVSKLNSQQLAKIRNKKIGFIFQSFALINEYSVLENIQIPLKYRKVPLKESKIKALEYLKKVNLEECKKKKPSQLSGGQQQRVAIARALVGNPDIILADEPTGALDQKNGEEIINLLLDINSQGKTVIIITHDINIASYCKRNIVIKDGKIVDDLVL